MARYRVELFDRKTQRQLDRIHEPDFSRIAEAILKLEDDPRPQVESCAGWKAGAFVWATGV